MKLKYEFETTALGERIIAVPVGENAQDFSGVLDLNESALAVFELLKEDTTLERIVAALAEQYEASPEELTAYAEAFLKKLRDEDLLAE